MDITFYLFFIALLVSFAAWCVFLWAIRAGQFHDVEGIKYQVWPAAEQGGEDRAVLGAAEEEAAPSRDTGGAR